jgi:pimeloyl-ACP methyl ester carboxylesterase
MTLHFAIPAGIAAVALTGALGTLGLWRSSKRPRFHYNAHSLSEADYCAIATKPGWHEHRFSAAPGVELRGLLREPAAPTGPWVLFFNGNSAQMLSEGQLVLDALCTELGWGGVVWAYRGFDSSAGTPDPASLADDGFRIYSQLVAERNIPPNCMHLVGFSLGTSIAAAVAARACQRPPASLTLLAPFTKLYLSERRHLLLHRYETSKWLDRIASPVLVVHGSRDTTLKVEDGRAVAEALASRATLLELPELGHCELPLSPAAQDAMRAFITKHTAPGALQPIRRS